VSFPDKKTFGGAKFDIQLGDAKVHERHLEALLLNGTIELKTETWQWEQTGNLCIEYRQNGQPSGIAVTEADVWAHELCSPDGQTRVWLMFPVERLKRLAREAYKAGRWRKGGDGERFEMVLIPIKGLFYD
jgi:hypothetical protein